VTDKINNCPNCGAELKIGDKNCSFCGSEFKSAVKVKSEINLLSIKCPFCDYKLEKEKKHCPSCGENLQLECPRCGKASFIRCMHCGNCGVNISDLSSYLISNDEIKLTEYIVSRLESGDFEFPENTLERLIEKFPSNNRISFEYAKCLSKRISKMVFSGTMENYRKEQILKLSKVVNKITSSNANEEIKTEAKNLMLLSSTRSENSCFVASVVFESQFHPEVIKLRTYRDEILNKNILGILLIKIYYKVGPKIATVMSKDNLLIKKLKEIIRVWIISFNKSKTNKSKGVK
jgi:hypothetical protein|tara:strand:- start:1451 stop:2323 length:873 start_codon:yes stop_codon:yes gene_type:complete